ncbi:MAG: MFS transporter [Gammaproteobacteria bacterium]|jgi:MFS family permease|nr:MFS transporter [Gammaproteobacteria bacterium]MDH3863359.1 MFS transporter [Gammaproteobacteria bacterium]MDH3906182.1 MFS transporter [Gammaproteobacteria bacterium]MDH3908323.1 MFS transporter [Gammaproteobacteria bacterium]MDH4003240.1 MFS transporter [Gammaproteobacteria bacterium]
MTPGESDSTTTWLPAERRAISVIALIGMLRMFGLFALLPVLALHAATLDGATPILIGMAVGAYGLTQAGLQIPLGALSDRIGRVPVIVAGLAVFAAGSILAAYSDSVWGVIAGRLLQGAGAISATLTALIADATRDGVRTRSMAVFGVGVGGAFMLAMIFGPKFSGHFGVPALFLFAAFLALVAAFLLVALPADIPRPETPRRWNFRPAFRPELLRLDIFVFLLHAILTASFVALPFLLVDRLELPVTDHWKMYVGALLLSLAGTIPLIIRDERQGKGSTIGIAVTLMLAGQLVLTFAGFATATVFGGLVLFFAGFNFLEAGLPARLSLVADDDSRGASLGLFASAQFFGAFVGGLIGGRFLATGRPADVFFVCVLLAAIWLAMQSFGRFRST